MKSKMVHVNDLNDAKYESVFPVIGEMGPFQLRNYLILCLPAIILGMQAYGNNVLITKPPDGINISCFGNQSVEVKSTPSGHIIQATNSSASINCSLVDVEDAERRSVIAAFRLFGDYDFLLRFPNIAVYFGMLVGSFAFGNLSDYIGRRYTIWICLVWLTVSSALIAIPMEAKPYNFYFFLFFRFFSGTAQTGVYVTSFVLSMELVGPSWRPFAGSIVRIFFATGPVSAGALALVLEDWRHLALALSLPAILIFPLSFTLPESPRWLLSKGKSEEFKKLLVKAGNSNRSFTTDTTSTDKATIGNQSGGREAGGDGNVNVDDGGRAGSSLGEDSSNMKKMNRKDFSILLEAIVKNEMEKKDRDKAETKTLFLQLFRGRQSCPKNCLIFFNWSIVAGVYYGVTLNTAKMTVSPMMGLIVSGIVEVISYLALLPLLNRMGRKKTFVGSMVFAGALCFASIFSTGDTVAFTLSMTGKFFISSSFAVIYIYAAELFPTEIRNTGMGVSSLTARIGSMLSPLLVDLAPNAVLPLAVFGALAAISGSLSLLLPETLGLPLPETWQDAEDTKLVLPNCRRNTVLHDESSRRNDCYKNSG